MLIPIATVIFRVEANPIIGMGHLMRCLTLATAFQEKGVNVVFVCSSIAVRYLPENMSPEITIEEALDKQGVNDLACQVAKYHADMVVIDGYDFGVDYIENARNAIKAQPETYGVRIVLMDDENILGTLPVDVVVNSSEAALRLGYDNTAPTAMKLLGPEYALLRNEFRELKPAVLESRGYCVLTMGGADPLGLTLPMLKRLTLLDMCIPLVVITGVANLAHEEIALFCHRRSDQITYYHNVSDMAELFSGAKMAIAAAGSTIAELGCMRVPSLLCVVADNQLASAQAAEEGKWCKYFDCRKVTPWDEIIAQAIECWRDDAVLNAMYLSTHGRYNVNGAEKIVDAIFENSA